LPHVETVECDGSEFVISSAPQLRLHRLLTHKLLSRHIHN
jgi:hypothetical protein